MSPPLKSEVSTVAVVSSSVGIMPPVGSSLLAFVASSVTSSLPVDASEESSVPSSAFEAFVVSFSSEDVSSVVVVVVEVFAEELSSESPHETSADVITMHIARIAASFFIYKLLSDVYSSGYFSDQSLVRIC